MPPAVTFAFDVLIALLAVHLVGCLYVLLRGCLILRVWRREAPFVERAAILKSPLTPGVSVLLAPPDASSAWHAFARRLLGLEFADSEVVVVLEDATPDELQSWAREFRLFPSLETVAGPLATGAVRGVYESSAAIRLVVVDKDPGPPGDALNAAVNAASLPVLACFDPETEFQQDALLRLVWPMLDSRGEITAVASAVACGTSESLLGGFTEIEFLRSWLGRSIAFAGWNAMIPEPGCAMLVERQAVIDAGGCWGGLAPMFVALHGRARAAGRKYRIPFIPDPLTSLELRGDLSSLLRQVVRRQAWIAQAMRRAPSLTGGWSSLGRWGLSALLFTRLLRPLAETALYLLVIAALLFGWIGWGLALTALLVTMASGTIISASAVVLREVAEYTPAPPGRLIRLLVASLAEGFGYRQLRDLKMIAAFFSEAL